MLWHTGFSDWSDGNTENPRTVEVAQYANILLTAEFEAATPTNLETAAENGVRIAGDIIENPNNALVELYTLAGLRVLASQASTIDLGGLAHGVYVAKTGDATIKFAR